MQATRMMRADPMKTPKATDERIPSRSYSLGGFTLLSRRLKLPLGFTVNDQTRKFINGQFLFTRAG
jgi:hypothetical protein